MPPVQGVVQWVGLGVTLQWGMCLDATEHVPIQHHLSVPPFPVQGTGVGPRSRQPTNPIQHAANKISSLVSGGKADDVEWRTSNRCSRCQGRGVCRCEECGGTGRRGPSEEES